MTLRATRPSIPRSGQHDRVGREACTAARPARDPPVRYRDKLSQRRQGVPFVPIREADCLPIDSLTRTVPPAFAEKWLFAWVERFGARYPEYELG